MKEKKATKGRTKLVDRLHKRVQETEGKVERHGVRLVRVEGDILALSRETCGHDKALNRILNPPPYTGWAKVGWAAMSWALFALGMWLTVWVEGHGVTFSEKVCGLGGALLAMYSGGTGALFTIAAFLKVGDRS